MEVLRWTDYVGSILNKLSGFKMKNTLNNFLKIVLTILFYHKTINRLTVFNMKCVYVYVIDSTNSTVPENTTDVTDWRRSWYFMDLTHYQSACI